MKPIVLTEERMNEILPQNIKDTDVISANAKKVLAAIMNYFLSLDKVKEQGSVHLSNTLLRQSARIKQNYLLGAIQELKEHDLIKREVGSIWKEGEQHTASIYYVMWNNLVKPLKKKTFEDLFSQFLKSSETSMGTTVSDTVTVSDLETVADAVVVEDKVLETVEVNDNKNIKYNKFEEFDKFIEDCFKNKTTYQETVSQIGIIFKWIRDRYSEKHNVEMYTNYANDLISKKLEVFKTVSQ